MVDFTEGYRPKESETQKAIKLLQSKGYDVVPSRPYDFVEVTKPPELTEVQYHTGGPWHNAKVVAYHLDEVWLINLDNNCSMVLLADDVKFRMLRTKVPSPPEKPTGPGNRCIRENGVYPPGAE